MKPPSVHDPAPLRTGAGVWPYGAYRMARPVTERAISRRWISDVPSKIVMILASRCQRSTG